MFAFLAIQQSDGLTLMEVIRDIPHDGPAFVIYIMLAMFAGMIWAGSRQRAS